MKNKFRKFRLIYFENRYHAKFDCQYHGLRTPNEGINQRYLEILVDAASKICFGRTEEFGIGIEFSAVQWRLFPLWAYIVRGQYQIELYT